MKKATANSGPVLVNCLKRIRILSVAGLLQGMAANESIFIAARATVGTEEFWKAGGCTASNNPEVVGSLGGSTAPTSEAVLSYVPATGINTFVAADLVSICLPDITLDRDTLVSIEGSQSGSATGEVTVWYEELG